MSPFCNILACNTVFLAQDNIVSETLKCEVLSSTALDQMLLDVGVLKADHFGLKIARTSDNRIIKLFRRRRKLSSSLWSPYARRFVRNAEILHRLSIPTIAVEKIFFVSETGEYGVIYEHLEGTTLRALLEQIGDQEKRNVLIERLACFLAELHAKGILFRSNHFANILVTSEGEFALIDITDLKARRWGPLNVFQRVRNFKHLTRYVSDKRWIDGFSWDNFLSIYLENYRCNNFVHWMFIRLIQKLKESSFTIEWQRNFWIFSLFKPR